MPNIELETNPNDSSFDNAKLPKRHNLMIMRIQIK